MVLLLRMCLEFQWSNSGLLARLSHCDSASLFSRAAKSTVRQYCSAAPETVSVVLESPLLLQIGNIYLSGFEKDDKDLKTAGTS